MNKQSPITQYFQLNKQTFSQPSKSPLSQTPNVAKKRKFQETINSKSPSSDITTLPRSFPGISRPKQKPCIPTKFMQLETIFHALESTVTFMNGRDQQVIFHKIQRAVENIANKNFEFKHLAQMLTVCPGLYEIEPIDIIHMGQRKKSLSIKLPRKNHTIVDKDTTVRFGGKLSKMSASSVDDKLTMQMALGSNELIYDRKKKFHDALVAIVQIEYQKFLKELPLYKGSGFHPDFNLEDLPDIQQADLPSLEFVKPNVLTVIKPKPLQETSNNVILNPVSSEANDVKKPMSRAASLLERIREKEKKAKENQQPVLDAATIRRKAMLTRLPEMVQSIKLFFSKENKNVISYYKVAQHVASSMQKNPIREDEAPDHINLLCNVVPEFLSVITTDSGTILKIENVKFGDIEERIKKEL